MIEKDSVILDLYDYNDLLQEHLLLERFNDSIKYYDIDGEETAEYQAHYITIDKKALKELLDTNVSDIRITSKK